MPRARNAKRHDGSYRRLFSHPQMVEALLRRYVAQEWVDQLDFETLQPVPGHYVSKRLEQRESDLVWRLKLRPGGDWFYVYILLELVAMLGQEEEFEAIRRDIASWLNRVILPARIPGQPIHEVRDLQEVDEMLAETVKTWPKQWMAEGLEKGRREGRQQGRREGRQEGRQEGRREGRLEVLQLLIENRFGALSAEHRSRLESADSDQLSSWATRIMSASSVDEVLRD